MVPDPGTPLRAHRLRPLNQPQRVFVELNERGLPVVVLEPRQGRQPFHPSPRPSAEAAEQRLAPDAGPGSPETADPPIRRPVESVGEVWRVDDEWWRRPV